MNGTQVSARPLPFPQWLFVFALPRNFPSHGTAPAWRLGRVAHGATQSAFCSVVWGVSRSHCLHGRLHGAALMRGNRHLEVLWARRSTVGQAARIAGGCAAAAAAADAACGDRRGGYAHGGDNAGQVGNLTSPSPWSNSVVKRRSLASTLSDVWHPSASLMHDVKYISDHCHNSRLAGQSRGRPS
jgi:hypothetical protein